MSVIAQPSAFNSSFKAPSLFSSKSAFKKPSQGLSAINSHKKPTSPNKSRRSSRSPTKGKLELTQIAQAPLSSEAVFGEPVKKLKTSLVESSSMDFPQPNKSTKLAMEDVFNTGTKLEFDQVFDEQPEDCSDLSFISSDESLEEIEEKSVENKNKVDEEVLEEPQQEIQPEKEVESEPAPQLVESVPEPVEEVVPEETVEEPVQPVQSHNINIQPLAAQLPVQERAINPMDYYAEVANSMAYNPYSNLQSLYQSNQYSTANLQQQYALMQQRLQRERYSGYNSYGSNSYVSNNDLLMAYNLSLNNMNNVYNTPSSYSSYSGLSNRPDMSYYMQQYQSMLNPTQNSYLNNYQQLQLLQQQQQLNSMDYRNYNINRSTGFAEESRRAKHSFNEEYVEDNESYTTMCPNENSNRDTAENSDSNKSQKAFSPLINTNKEVQKEKELTGIKRPFTEEKALIANENATKLHDTKKVNKSKQVKEAKEAKTPEDAKKKRGMDLKQDLAPVYAKVERKLNRYQLLRYQNGNFEEGDNIFTELGEAEQNRKVVSDKVKRTAPEEEKWEDILTMPNEEEPFGDHLKADLPPFMQENDSQRGRKIKLLWTPEVMTEENLSGFCQKLAEVTQNPVVTQQDAIKLLISNNMDVQKAFETVSLDVEFYKELFRLKVKKTRGRKPNGYIEASY